MNEDSKAEVVTSGKNWHPSGMWRKASALTRLGTFLLAVTLCALMALPSQAITRTVPVPAPVPAPAPLEQLKGEPAVTGQTACTGVLPFPLDLRNGLFAANNPVNLIDPSGHSFILEFTITSAKRAGIAAATMGTISAGFTYAKTRSLKAAVWQGSKTAGLTGFAFLSPAFAASMLATLPAQVGLAVYNEELTWENSPEVATYIVAAVALNYLFKSQAIPPNPAVVSGILRDASRTGIGNSGVGAGTVSEALMAGRSWVGDGFRVASNGKAWISADGLRQFRLPSYKPNQGRWQANYEQRSAPSGKWTANSHLDIIAPEGANTALQNAAAAGAAISQFYGDDEDEE